MRIYKTRALSTDACRSNHVKINGTAIKASHTTRIGETTKKDRRALDEMM